MKDLFKRYGLKPNKKFGQNFLTSQRVVEKIIKNADLKPNDVILEIGPGYGILTKELAKNAKKIIAVEKDKKIEKALKKELKDFNNIKIINQDILDCELKIKNYKIVANLPFNIASIIIRTFLEIKNKPKEMVLMVQKEVAQRICANPPKMSILAVSVQFYSKPKLLFYVPKKLFFPKPKVDAAVIKISVSDRSEDQMFNNKFFKIVKAGFSHPRKQIINNLSEELNMGKKEVENWLKKNNINPSQRAQTLSVDNWIELVKSSNLLSWQ